MIETFTDNPYASAVRTTSAIVLLGVMGRYCLKYPDIIAGLERGMQYLKQDLAESCNLEAERIRRIENYALEAVLFGPDQRPPSLGLNERAVLEAYFRNDFDVLCNEAMKPSVSDSKEYFTLGEAIWKLLHK